MNNVSIGGLEVASNEEDSPRLLGLYDILLEAPLDVLGRVLGEKPAKLILGHLEKTKPSPEHDREAGFEAYSDILRRLLGSGSTIVEKSILKALFTRFELNFTEKKGYRFQDYMNELKEECKREG